MKDKIYPVEVRSGTGKNTISLRSYADKYKPEIIFRTSPINFMTDKDFINVPLYAVCSIEKILEFQALNPNP